MLDNVDSCIDRPETRNSHQDRDGCPDEIPADLATVTGIMHGVEFEVDRDVFKRSSFAVLDRAMLVDSGP